MWLLNVVFTFKSALAGGAALSGVLFAGANPMFTNANNLVLTSDSSTGINIAKQFVAQVAHMLLSRTCCFGGATTKICTRCCSSLDYAKGSFTVTLLSMLCCHDSAVSVLDCHKCSQLWLCHVACESGPSAKSSSMQRWDSPVVF